MLNIYLNNGYSSCNDDKNENKNIYLSYFHLNHNVSISNYEQTVHLMTLFHGFGHALEANRNNLHIQIEGCYEQTLVRNVDSIVIHSPLLFLNSTNG